MRDRFRFDGAHGQVQAAKSTAEQAGRRDRAQSRRYGSTHMAGVTHMSDQATSPDAIFELSVAAHSGSYDDADDRWQAQVRTLHADLRSQVDVTERSTPVDGTKGAVAEIIVALGSAGAFTVALDCFRAWLGRDRSRSIDVRWNENGTEQHVTLTADAIDVDSVREIARAAAHRVGGTAWAAGTEPS